ncbi:hypothetical protein [Parvibacter caecicola]|nr:hypothetical protein [Parvibacter caecicola]
MNQVEYATGVDMKSCYSKKLTDSQGRNRIFVYNAKGQLIDMKKVR